MKRVNFRDADDAVLAAAALTSDERGRLSYIEDEEGVGFEGPSALIAALAAVDLAAATTGELQRIKEEAGAAIDAAAERLRRQVVTPGEGQAATYLKQEEEAKLVLSYLPAPIPAGTTTPYLSALVGVIGKDLETVARTVLAKADAWHKANAAINAARLAAKAAIDAASSEAGVKAAVDAVAWPELPAV